jgi:WD40 repeat protein
MCTLKHVEAGPTALRFTADVTCLDTDESGALLASGSADMTIKVTDTAAYTDKTFKGHSGPVLSVSLDPRKEFLASSSCDGSVRVWSLANTSQVTAHLFTVCVCVCVLLGSIFRSENDIYPPRPL